MFFNCILLLIYEDLDRGPSFECSLIFNVIFLYSLKLMALFFSILYTLTFSVDLTNYSPFLFVYPDFLNSFVCPFFCRLSPLFSVPFFALILSMFLFLTHYSLALVVCPVFLYSLYFGPFFSVYLANYSLMCTPCPVLHFSLYFNIHVVLNYYCSVHKI